MTANTDYLTRTNVLKGAVILIGLTVGFSLTTGGLLGGRVIFNLDMSPEDYLGVLTHLAIISLITERFVEIFTSVIRVPNRVVLEGDLRKLLESGDEVAKHDAIEALDTYKAKTGIFAMSISFIAGLIIASVGIHVLGPLFDISGLEPTQKKFFVAIDIVITAGLIAGGSKGVNSLTSSIGAVFDAMKYQSRATQERAKKDITN